MRGPIAGARLRLPIRLKLAVVSGGLTFVILLAFALVVGAFTEQKLQSSFDSDLRAAAADLQSEFQVNGVSSQIDINQFRAAAAGGAVLRVWNRVTGRVYELRDRPDLGPLYEGIRDVGDYRVISRPLFVRSLTTTGTFDSTPRPFDGAVAAIQYGKPTGNLNATIGRVRFFLLLGVVIGTVFAFLVGFWVARRAMRPISGPAAGVSRRRCRGFSRTRLIRARCSAKRWIRCCSGTPRGAAHKCCSRFRPSR